MGLLNSMRGEIRFETLRVLPPQEIDEHAFALNSSLTGSSCLTDSANTSSTLSPMRAASCWV